MKEILDNLTYLSKTSGQTAQVLNNLNLENPLGFGLQLNLALFERIHSQAKSLNLLWGEIIEGEVSIEQSAGILIRSLLLDTMLVLKQSLSIKGEKQSSDVIIKFDEFAKKVLSDGLEGVFKHLEKGKLLGIYNENQIHNAFSEFATEYNALIETYSNDGTIPIVSSKTKINAADIFNELVSDDNLKIIISSVYHSYLFFSKYEHLSIMYFSVKKQDLVLKYNAHKEAVELLILSLTLILDITKIYYPNLIFLQKQKEDTLLYMKNMFENKKN